MLRSAAHRRRSSVEGHFATGTDEAYLGWRASVPPVDGNPALEVGEECERGDRHPCSGARAQHPFAAPREASGGVPHLEAGLARRCIERKIGELQLVTSYCRLLMQVDDVWELKVV